MSDIVSICRTAWQQTKKAHQPDYDDLVESYRTMLTARAEGAIATGSVSEDAPFQSFERAVLDVPRPSEPEPAPEAETSTHEVSEVEPLSPEVAQAEEERLERAARREAAQPKKKPAAKKTVPKKATKKPVVKKAAKKAVKKVAPKK